MRFRVNTGFFVSILHSVEFSPIAAMKYSTYFKNRHCNNGKYSYNIQCIELDAHRAARPVLSERHMGDRALI